MIVVQPCDRGIIDGEPCPRMLRREVEPLPRRMLLGAGILASSMGFIDGSALMVALPELRTYFGTDLASVQWVVNGYVLTLAAFSLVGGALADHYGKARVLAVGCLGFSLASGVCAAAPSIEVLIACRVVQGIAAAIVAPSSLALIGAIYPKEERSRAIGTWAAASALTTAGGPVLGGWLTENFGWQWIFLINPPLALIAIALLIRYAPADRREQRRFDLVGAAILAAALGAIAWALSRIGQGRAGEASGVVTGLFALMGAAALAGYVLWERTTSHPLTPPRLAHNRAFVILNDATLLLYTATAILFFLLPFDLVDRRGLSPAHAGLLFLPFTLGVGVLSRLFGALADRVGPRTMLIAGSLGAAPALLSMALGKTASLVTGVIFPMTLLGISFAMLVPPLTASVISSVEDSDEGLASGINNAVSRVAQLAGIALSAGLGSHTWGYQAGLIIAAFFAISSAILLAAALPPTPQQRGSTRRGWN